MNADELKENIYMVCLCIFVIICIYGIIAGQKYSKTDTKKPAAVQTQVTKPVENNNKSKTPVQKTIQQKTQKQDIKVNKNEKKNQVKDVWNKKNIKFDRNAVAKTYKTAKNYCDKHIGDKDEYGYLIYGGNSGHNMCIGDYISKKSNNITKKIDDEIIEYCLKKFGGGGAAYRNCYYSAINNIK